MCIPKSTSVCCSAQAVVSKITVDQLMSAPLGTAVFFTSMKWLEGRSDEIKSTIEVTPLSDNRIFLFQTGTHVNKSFSEHQLEDFVPYLDLRLRSGIGS